MGFNQYSREFNVPCSRTQHGHPCWDRTPVTLDSEADALPLGHRANIRADFFFNLSHLKLFLFVCLFTASVISIRWYGTTRIPVFIQNKTLQGSFP